MFRLGKDEKKALLILVMVLLTRFSCATPDGVLDSGMVVSWLFFKSTFLRVRMLKTGRTEKMLLLLATRLIRLVRLLT
jgi:hypothetical protein